MGKGEISEKAGEKMRDWGLSIADSS